MSEFTLQRETRKVALSTKFWRLDFDFLPCLPVQRSSVFCGSCRPVLAAVVLLHPSMWLAVTVLGAAVVTASQTSPSDRQSRCRCTPPDPCWSAVPWAALNASVGGRLVKTVDELQPCLDNIGSDACSAALAMTDDEFWLADRHVAACMTPTVSCCEPLRFAFTFLSWCFVDTRNLWHHNETQTRKILPFLTRIFYYKSHNN